MTGETGYFSELNGARVLITGGGRGIGRDIALALAELGAQVLVVGRDETSLSTTVEKLKRHSPNWAVLTSW